MTKSKRLITALTVVMLLTIISVLALMLYPLYHSTFTNEVDVEIPFYLTIDGKEVEYTKTETLSRDSFIIPFIKGEKLDIEDRYGYWNVYRWKIVPWDDSEYLIFELNDERAAAINEHSYDSEGDWKTKVIFIGKRVSEE